MSEQEILSFLENLDKTLEPSLALTLAGLAITVSIFLTGVISSLSNTIQRIKDSGGTPAQWQTSRLASGKSAINRLLFSFYALLAATLEGLSLDQLVDLDSMANLMGLEVFLSGSFTALGILFFWLGAKEVAGLVKD